MVTAYANDPRVIRHEDGSFTVHVSPGVEAHVVFSASGWRAFAPGQLLGGTYTQFGVADDDEAIHSLIGDPA